MLQQAIGIIRRGGFILGIAVVLVLSRLLSEWGEALKAAHVPGIAVFLIFLRSGLTTHFSGLIDAAGKWRGHLLIQGSVFVLVPMGLWAASSLIADEQLRMGVYLVAAVPTTISSCFVYTQLAGGDGHLALLNAVAGNALGVVASPLLLGALSGGGAESGAANVAGTIQKLIVLVLVPFVLGHVIAWRSEPVRDRVERFPVPVPQILILLIMFCAFATSWERLSATDLRQLWICLACLALFHLLLCGAVALLGAALRLDRRDRIAVFFCSTQKTLAMGIPLAMAFFSGSIGMILVPITFYHFFQLVFGSAMIPVWRRSVEKADASA